MKAQQCVCAGNCHGARATRKARLAAIPACAAPSRLRPEGAASLQPRLLDDMDLSPPRRGQRFCGGAAEHSAEVILIRNGEPDCGRGACTHQAIQEGVDCFGCFFDHLVLVGHHLHCGVVHVHCQVRTEGQEAQALAQGQDHHHLHDTQCDGAACPEA